MLIPVALEVEFYWHNLLLSEGAVALAAIVGSVAALLGAYRLIRFPASRNIEAFILTAINAPICVASFAFLDTDKKVWPGYFWTTCSTFDSPEQTDPMVIVDGIYSTIRIAPGGRIRLNVPTELPNQFKDGHRLAHCRVRLKLEGGTFIETYDFEPK